MALEQVVNTTEVTTPQKGVVFGLVCLGHYLVMWGLLWVKIPQLPSTPVTRIQVEWIELATLASATPNQAESVNTNTAADLTDNVKSSQTPKLEPKTEPKTIPKSAPKTAPSTRKAQPQPTPTLKPQPKLKSEPKLEPQVQIANTVIKNSQQDDSKTNARNYNNPNQDKDKDRDRGRDEPKTQNTPPTASSNDDNNGREKGEKSKKGDNSTNTNPSSQDVGMGNNAQNNVGNQDSSKPAKSNALEQNWSAQVRNKLQRDLNYPDEALSKKWSGKPTLSITIDKAGNVLSVSVVKSSGKAILDKEAIATARRASPLPAPPDEIMNGQGKKSFSIPVRFNLKSQ